MFISWQMVGNVASVVVSEKLNDTTPRIIRAMPLVKNSIQISLSFCASGNLIVTVFMAGPARNSMTASQEDGYGLVSPGQLSDW